MRATEIAPSTLITGGSNYKGKPDKADRIERIAYEKLKKTNKTIDRIVSQYVRLQPRKTAEERRQARREYITPYLKKTKEKGKKIHYSGTWYPIVRINRKTITVKASH